MRLPDNSNPPSSSAGSQPAPSSQGRVPPGYLTSAQAAEYLGVSAKTLENWRRKKQGPPCYQVRQRDAKRCKLVLYRIVELDAWMAQFRVDNTAQGRERAEGGAL